MNTNSNRFRLQELIESELGCSDPENIGSYKTKFERFSITPENKEKFVNALTEDAADIFYKATWTYAEAVSAIARGHQSWAIIKLYYALFYFLRCLIAARGLGVVKCKGIYTLRVEVGASPVKRDGGKHRGEDVRGDHKTTIAIYEKDFGQSDIFLSNKVSEQNIFDWMMKAIERINYRDATFSEPNFDFFESSVKDDGGVLRWIIAYLNDQPPTFMFLESHCSLAAPTFLLSLVRAELRSRLGLHEPLREEQFESLLKLLEGTGLEHNFTFRSLLKN